MRIIHIFEAWLKPSGGMGRVSYHWLKSFARSGYKVESIDASNVSGCLHRSFFDIKARQIVEKMVTHGDILFVHEPLAGSFIDLGVPVVVFSHGVEERLATVTTKFRLEQKTLRSVLTYVLWARRSWVRTRGLKEADLALVLNREDFDYALTRYGRSRDNTFLYRNGVNVGRDSCAHHESDGKRILFVGSWLERKGISLLRKAYQHFRESGEELLWQFAGSHIPETAVREYLGAENDTNVSILSSFDPRCEADVYAKANIFVLPSYVEGQPLALLQAMEYGLCCITTNTCGQRDIITDRYNGLLFDVGNISQFISLISVAIRNVELVKRLGCEAKCSMNDRRWPYVADEVVDIVEKKFGRR